MWVPMAHAGHWAPALAFSSVPVLVLVGYFLITGSIDRRRERRAGGVGGGEHEPPAEATASPLVPPVDSSGQW